MRKWPAADEQFLRRFYKVLGAHYVAEELERPFWAVARKASRMGLKRGARVDPQQIQKVDELKPTEAAYLAGILDGEGTISIKNYGGEVPQPVVYLSISTTDKELHSWLLAKVGGTVNTHRPRNPQHRLVYQWHTESLAHVLAILLRVGAYLVTKQPHARIASEACWIRTQRPRASKATAREIALWRQIGPLQLKKFRRKP